MSEKTQYGLTNQEMWEDPQIKQLVLDWIRKQDHPDYLSRIRTVVRALPWLHAVALLVSAVICFVLDGAKVSHVGAALIAFSTAITGFCVLLASDWNAKVVALNYAHSAMHPKRLYDRFKADMENSQRHERLGREWYQYYAKAKYQKLIGYVVIWELLVATFGTALWGFADLLSATNVEFRLFVCSLL